MNDWLQSVLNKITHFSGVTGKASYFADVSAGYELDQFLPDKRWHMVTAQAGSTGAWHAPMLSPYTHMAFAIESPIYWMINKQRLDGRSDGVNLNFANSYLPAVQAATFSAEEKRIFKNWLESGAYLHQGAKPKDYKPPQ